MKVDGSTFWARVLEKNPYNTLSKLIAKTDLNYDIVKRQKFSGSMPKTMDVYHLSKVLNTTMEYLVAGEEEPTPTSSYSENMSPRLEKIVRRLESVVATEEDYYFVEKLLGLPHPDGIFLTKEASNV